MHYQDPGKIPETHLPCGHTVIWCEECCREQQHYNDYLDWCARWEHPGIMFAINSGHVVHARGCTAVYGPDRVTPDDPWNGLNGSKPLTQAEATEWLRQSHDRRRCMLCGPDVPMPRWVKVGRRWQLADEAYMP
jgi:hypothetical protein